VLLALVVLLNGVVQAAGNRRRPAAAASLALMAQIATLAWLTPRWGAAGAASSLLVAGAVALAGLTVLAISCIRIDGLMGFRRLKFGSFSRGVDNLDLGFRKIKTSSAKICVNLCPFVKRPKFRALKGCLPLLAMAIPLLLLSDEGWQAAALKLGLAGMAYGGTLAACEAPLNFNRMRVSESYER